MPGVAELVVLLVSGGGLLALFGGVLVALKLAYRRVDQGEALVIHKMSAEPVVTFTGGVVLPIIHHAEVMDITTRSLCLDLSGRDALICADDGRLDAEATLFVRVNKTPEDVLEVAQSIGCARASYPETLEELFSAKLREAVKTAARQLTLEQCVTTSALKDRAIEIIGLDLGGFRLEDLAIDPLDLQAR